MAVPRTTQPIYSTSYADELLETRARADISQAEQTQTQQTVASEDAFARLRRNVVGPLRAHLPPLQRRNTVALLREGVDQATLRRLPPEVLRAAAEEAASTPIHSSLGDAVLTAEATNLVLQQQFASALHTQLIGAIEELSVAKREFRRIVEREALAASDGQSSISTPAASAAADTFYRAVVERVGYFQVAKEAVDELLAGPRVSAKTTGFFLEFCDAISRAAFRLDRAASENDRVQAAGSVDQLFQRAVRKW